MTSHSELSAVFDIPPPDSLLAEIAADDGMTRHLIRRQFTPRHGGALDGGQTPPSLEEHAAGGAGTTKKLNRRDSIATFPGLRAELQGVLSESDEVTAITSRLEALEESVLRIEAMMVRLTDGFVGSETGSPIPDAQRHASYSDDNDEDGSLDR